MYLKKKTTESEQRYKTYRNTLQKIIRKRKYDFYNKQCTVFKSNTKKLWSMINTVTKKSHDKSCIIDNLKINNIEYPRGADIVNGLGKYFSTVGESFPNNIPKSKKNISEYVDLITRNERSVFLNPCTAIEIKRITK